ncbi:hypothetical protein PSECIP111951_00920 [Pseudoalteromonas holothuriae]|uniref:Uncharacterized protein n=1 Tax=Pseudoalteromonas holothuriae TaxID=2963714 RepID=A0A9W4QVY4_9GAMM|nr:MULTISPECIES: hypothetical protein [unclassified Pseudoalteromonas]CAH9053916.1 hypothetical protein PSECIP111951_00920 [Pseudoalteromonas sp. CIP111951]CAH9055702.1 hypothetical protein PSECIP111854_01631 [Pseudoalteromonas sp. CIP111854]
MPNLNSLAYGLISVLLTLCTAFVFIDNGNRAIEIAKSKPLPSYFRVYGHSP